MPAKVLWLCLLALATLTAAKNVHSAKKDSEIPHGYKTVEARLLDGVRLRRGPSYKVAAGVCNVTLSPRELCGEGLVVASMEVAVLNPGQQYAEVVFEMRDKHQVRVHLDSCLRPWSVDLRLACLRQKLSRSRSRVLLDQQYA